MEQPLFLVGQFLGIVAIGLGFLSYQMKTQNGLLLAQTSTTLVFCLHYLLIGAYSGMALNAVALLRNLVFFFLSKKGKIHKAWAVGFSAVMGIMGLLSWESWYSIFVFLGLVINSYCMSFDNPQNIRKSILVTSPLVLLYDVFVWSIGGIIYESVAICSSAIGIFRNKTSKIS